MLRNKIIEILKKAVPEMAEIRISIPESDNFGHYSTNAAFALGKIWRMSPIQAAEKLKEKIINIDKSKLFKKINVVNPGFINFWLSDEMLQSELNEILKKKTKYGKPKLKSRGKIQLEYISANPTGPLTMANGRGGYLGDVLGNVLEFCGCKVEREYYVNDTGNQIITLGKSLIAALGLIPEEEKFYKGEYIKTWATKHKEFIKKNQAKHLIVGQSAAKDFLADIKKVIEKEAGIHFDRYTSEEKDIHKKKFIQRALEIFKNKGLVFEKENATWLKTTEFGDDKDRVLITGDGFPTYFLADSGHILETTTRGFSKKILVLGPDHYGYVARIKAAAKILGLAELNVLVTQAVRVVQEGKEVKMSKRQGEFITFGGVVDEVKPDAARFFFLMHSPESHMDFDLKLAKERSMKNPVYYVQYAYVRTRGILNKSQITKSKAQINYKLQTTNHKFLSTEADINLILALVRFPEIIEDTARDYQVHRLTRYATELSHTFHNFYEKERIVGEKDKSLAAARLQLVQATQIVLGDLLDLLGISQPKKM